MEYLKICNLVYQGRHHWELYWKSKFVIPNFLRKQVLFIHLYIHLRCIFVVSLALNFLIQRVALTYFFAGFYTAVREMGELPNTKSWIQRYAFTRKLIVLWLLKIKKYLATTSKTADYSAAVDGIIQNNQECCQVTDSYVPATTAKCLWQQCEMMFLPWISDFTAFTGYVA